MGHDPESHSNPHMFDAISSIVNDPTKCFAFGSHSHKGGVKKSHPSHRYTMISIQVGCDIVKPYPQQVNACGAIHKKKDLLYINGFVFKHVW